MITKDRPREYFYKLSIDDSDPKGWMVVERDIKGFDRFRFFKSERIEDWPEGITFSFSRGEHVKDQLIGGGYWDLVSERVRQVFVNHSIRGVQFLPVNVIRKPSGKEVGTYWMLHVLQEVEALDWEHTMWTTSDIDKIKEHPALCILQQALILDRLEGIDIFRLKIQGEGYFSRYISDRLKKYLEDAQATSGFLFLPIAAY
jgi:hypothetical protein